jgi:hypothetical protein
MLLPNTDLSHGLAGAEPKPCEASRSSMAWLGFWIPYSVKPCGAEPSRAKLSRGNTTPGPLTPDLLIPSSRVRVCPRPGTHIQTRVRAPNYAPYLSLSQRAYLSPYRFPHLYRPRFLLVAHRARTQRIIDA